MSSLLFSMLCNIIPSNNDVVNYIFEELAYYLKVGGGKSDW